MRILQCSMMLICFLICAGNVDASKRSSPPNAKSHVEPRQENSRMMERRVEQKSVSYVLDPAKIEAVHRQQYGAQTGGKAYNPATMTEGKTIHDYVEKASVAHPNVPKEILPTFMIDVIESKSGKPTVWGKVGSAVGVYDPIFNPERAVAYVRDDLTVLDNVFSAERPGGAVPRKIYNPTAYNPAIAVIPGKTLLMSECVDYLQRKPQEVTGWFGRTSVEQTFQHVPPVLLQRYLELVFESKGSRSIKSLQEVAKDPGWPETNSQGDLVSRPTRVQELYKVMRNIETINAKKAIYAQEFSSNMGIPLGDFAVPSQGQSLRPSSVQRQNKSLDLSSGGFFESKGASSTKQLPREQSFLMIPSPDSHLHDARGGVPIKKLVQAPVENMRGYEGRAENLVEAFGFTPEQFVAPTGGLLGIGSNIANQIGLTTSVALVTSEQIAHNKVDLINHYTRQYANQPKENAFIALNKDIQALRTEMKVPAEDLQNLTALISGESSPTTKAKLTLLQKAQSARDQMNTEMIQQKVTEFMSEYAPSKGISIEQAIAKLDQVDAENKRIDRSDADAIVGEQSGQVAREVSSLLSRIQTEANALRAKSKSDFDQALVEASKEKDAAKRLDPSGLTEGSKANMKEYLVWTQVVEQLKIDKTSATNAEIKIQEAVDSIVPGLMQGYLAEHSHDPVIGALENLKLLYDTGEHSNLIQNIDAIKTKYVEKGLQDEGIANVITKLNGLHKKNPALSDLQIYEKVVETLQPEIRNRENFLKDVEVKKDTLRGLDKSVEESLADAVRLKEVAEKRSANSRDAKVLRKVVEDLQVEHAVEKSAVEKNQDVENRARQKAEEIWRDPATYDYIKKALQELSETLQAASELKNKITRLLEQYDQNDIHLNDFVINLVDIPDQTVHQKVEIILKNLNKENSPEVFKIYTKAIEKLNLKINAQAQRDVKVGAYLAKYNEITPRIIEDKIKALKNEQNKLNVQELDALRIKEIREFNEKVVNQEHKIGQGTSVEELIELYENVDRQFKARAGRAWQEGNVYRAYQAVVNIGSNLREGEVRQAAGLVPTAAGDLAGALNDFVGAVLGPIKDNLSGAAKVAITSIIASTMPTLIAIISNDDLTEEEKQQMKKNALGAMMQDVSLVVTSDLTGADASVIMSGNMEAITTSSGINYFVNKLVPQDPNPYSYGSASGPMSSVGYLNSTKNFQDKYNELAQQKALQLIEDKIKALKNERNKLNDLDLEVLRKKEIEEFNKKFTDREHKIPLTTSREELIELYEKAGRELKYRENIAREEGNAYKQQASTVSEIKYDSGVKSLTSNYSQYDASPYSSLYTPTYTPSHSYSPSSSNQTSSYVSTPSPTQYSRVSTQDSPSFNGSSYSRSRAFPSYEELMAMP